MNATKAASLLTICAAFVIFASAARAQTLLHHWKFDETSGSVASDSESSKSGTLTNGAVFNPGGVTGGAISLDSTDDHVLVASGGTPVDIIGKSFSISFWAKRDGTGEDYVIGQGDAGNTSESLHIGFRNAEQFTFAFWADDVNYTNAAVAGDLLNFHHWAVTYDADTNLQSVYLDGDPTPVVTRTSTNDFLGSGSNDFWIGRRRDGQNFGGLIDDVQVYGDVLSGADVQFLFQNPGQVVGIVPEPSSIVLAMLGLCGLCGLALRRRRR